MKVLQISTHFLPNLGGIETHLGDLTKALVKRHWQVFVLAYRPLTTKTDWKIYEMEGNLKVLRIPWIPGFFYKLVQSPVLEFLYLVPGLFLATPILLLLYNPEVINGHGLVAGFVSVFWGRLFGKKVVVSTHSIYHFPKRGLYKQFVRWIFSKSDFVLGLSKQAVSEIKSLNPENSRVDNFTYWVDLNKFKVQSAKFKVKKQLGWDDKFVILFVGRLVLEKGIKELLQAAGIWNKNIRLAIIGSGPLEGYLRSRFSRANIHFAGKIEQDKLPDFYNAADLLVVPSIHEEGFGRVILESLSCGLPVVGANRGAIPEAMDETVGKLIDITVQNIKNAVEYFYLHQDELRKLAKNCRNFAERRYSEKNVEKIIKAYLG
ncbi:glycosyltransferase family 4 protein [Candidatus Daviesbacteria bacterium]|nr:glycosyltransferase family 4 protein [Candidatus Daviesbacteria bacterium]